MTNKEKFRKGIEKLKSNLVYGACSSQVAMETRCKEEAYNEVLAILDTMQEEPTSWLEEFKAKVDSMSKEDFKKIFDKYAIDFEEEPVSESLNAESMIESYKQRLISQANGVKNSPLIDMCLASYKHGINETLDTLNLSNVQRNVKNWKEPVSEEWIEELRTKLDSMSKEEFKKVFDKYAIDFNEELVSEDLMDATNNYCVNVRKGYPRIMDETDRYICNAFKAGANWQKLQDMGITNKAQDVVDDILSSADSPLDAYATEVAFMMLPATLKESYHQTNRDRISDAVRLGAKWQKEQDQSTIELAEDHAMLAGMNKMKEQMMAKATDVEVKVGAGGYPYIPQMELYDYDKDAPLAKAGDKYKVVLIKEE